MTESPLNNPAEIDLVDTHDTVKCQADTQLPDKIGGSMGINNEMDSHTVTCLSTKVNVESTAIDQLDISTDDALSDVAILSSEEDESNSVQARISQTTESMRVNDLVNDTYCMNTIQPNRSLSASVQASIEDGNTNNSQGINNSSDHGETLDNLHIVTQSCDASYADPYVDGHLSGALEQLPTENVSILYMLEVLQKRNTEITDDCTLGDHAYCSITPKETQRINIPTNEKSVTVKSINDAINTAVNDEQGINSCEVDRSINDLLLSMQHVHFMEINHQISPERESAPVADLVSTYIDTFAEYSVSLSNTETDSICAQFANLSVKLTENSNNINEQENSEAVTGINMASGEKRVLGTNIRKTNMSGINSNQTVDANLMSNSMDNSSPNILGINDSDSSTEFEGFNENDLLRSKNMLADTASEIDGYTDSNSSSEFEGFTENDIYSPKRNDTMDTSSESFIELSDLNYEDAVSSSTECYSHIVEPENEPDASIGSLAYSRPPTSVAKLWHEDALRKRWTVPVPKLSARDIYNLSHAPPQWDKMDPYSDLENTDSNSDISQDEALKHDTPATPSSPEMPKTDYGLRPRNKPVQEKWKSKRKPKSSPVYIESSNEQESDDSDYKPRPKTVRNPNVGLKEPSKSRLRSQELITASRGSRNPENYLVRSTPSDRDKQCPHCPETFFYLEVVKTHLSHAHKDITEVKGIENPASVINNDRQNPVRDESGLQDMSGINNSSETSTMGTNKAVPEEPRVMGINDLSSAAVTQPATAPRAKTASQNHSKIAATTSDYYHHKRRSKNKGRHLRPTVPAGKQDQTPRKKCKSEFVTVTQGIKKTKKLHSFKCSICSYVTNILATANKHYRNTHPR